MRTEREVTWTMRFVFACLLIYFGCWIYWTGYHAGVKSVKVEDTIPYAIPTTCQEDMPCWDCKTMGNKVCGEPQNSDAVVVTVR